MYEFFLVSKFLSKIILLGENLFKPSSLQLSFGLSFFRVLEEIINESFLYLRKCVNLSVWISEILFVSLLYIKLILKKLYIPGCSNLLVEGGNDLSKHIVNKRLFNEFYLYKCAKSLSKSVNHKEFNFLNELKKNYKNKLKINKKLGKDVITLYK